MKTGDKVTVIGVWKPAYVRVVGEEQSVLAWRNTDKDFPRETVEINRYIIPWDQVPEEVRTDLAGETNPFPEHYRQHELWNRAHGVKPKELRAPALKELYS